MNDVKKHQSTLDIFNGVGWLSVIIKSPVDSLLQGF